jgi:hypothetical protein
MQDLDIAITPHLDDGMELGGWRNALVFDPMEKYGGFSYYEVRSMQEVCMMGDTCAGVEGLVRSTSHINFPVFPTLQVMLKPISQALNAVIKPSTQVWFAMQGTWYHCTGAPALPLTSTALRSAVYHMCNIMPQQSQQLSCTDSAQWSGMSSTSCVCRRNECYSCEATGLLDPSRCTHQG